MNRVTTRRQWQASSTVFHVVCFAKYCIINANKMRLWNTDAPCGNKVQIGYVWKQNYKVTDAGALWRGFIKV